jgi:toxin YoeB
MLICWSEHAWQDYIYWQKQDKTILNKINLIIKDIKRSNFEGIGSPEPLKHNWSGYWSRRINKEHRIIYKVLSDKELVIAQCRYHY